MPTPPEYRGRHPGHVFGWCGCTRSAELQRVVGIKPTMTENTFNKPTIMEDIRIDVDLRIIPTASGEGRSRSPNKKSREGEGSDSAETGRPVKKEKPGLASSKERRPSYVPAGCVVESTPVTEAGIMTRSGGRSAERRDLDACSQGPAAPRAALCGRPPESGKYIGVGRLREERKKKREEERFREVTKQRLKEEAIVREVRVKLGLPPAREPLPQKGESAARGPAAPADVDTSDEEEARTRSPKEELKRLDQQLEVIRKVAKCSSNLKGTFTKDLKEAASQIQEEARALREASSTEETKRLERENKRLRRELDELAREVAEIKKCVRTKGALPGETPAREKTTAPAHATAATSPTAGSTVEDIVARVMESTAVMVDGRMAALEDRLFPRGRPMRPPLEVDKRGGQQTADPQYTPGGKPPPGNERSSRRRTGSASGDEN